MIAHAPKHVTSAHGHEFWIIMWQRTQKSLQLWLQLGIKNPNKFSA